MSDEMQSWKSYVNAASRSVKNYVSQRDLKRVFPASRAVRAVDGAESPKNASWSQWAGQKLRRATQNDGTNFDKVALFPGWAARRYRRSSEPTDLSFDIEVFISGFASRSSGLGFGSRSGRAFLRLAKGFASLPKLAPSPESTINEAEYVQDGMWAELPVVSTQLTLPPEGVGDEKDGLVMEDLESRIRAAALDVDATSTQSNLTADTDSVASSYRSQSSMNSNMSSTSGQSTPGAPPTYMSSDLQRWHANLEARLYPFWASTLSSRTVRVSLFAASPALYASDDDASSHSSRTSEQQPLVTREVLTAADGSFQVRFRVSWEELCVHPAALQMAFGEHDLEYDVFVLAELFPAPSPATTPTYAHSPYPFDHSRPRTPVRIPTATSSISVPLTHASVRIISDIDDTVKLAGVLSGARTVFQNVFAKDLSDSVIEGMGDWYTSMWRRGVRFHYVSNGPFELLPVVNEFLQLSRLPAGSIKLRSYGGRSLFSGLLSAPAARKRAGVVDVLDSFPDSVFILVGDSGEQDLELYAGIAKERPMQILGVFIRDANMRSTAQGDTETHTLEDPTGACVLQQDVDAAARPSSRGNSPSILRRASTKSIPRRIPPRSISDSASNPSRAQKPMRTMSGSDFPVRQRSPNSYYPGVPPTTSPVMEEPVETPSVVAPQPRTATQSSYDSYSRPISDAERRQNDLQMRVYRARLDIPAHIPLRVFRSPDECVEAIALIDRLQG